MTCNVCGGRKKIDLPLRREMEFLESGDPLPNTEYGYKTFDCPQCVALVPQGPVAPTEPMVPYRRVRATKVMSAYAAEEFAKFQMPIERSLAARFGEYLLREGLIRFTTSGSKDTGAIADKITVTAHLGVVSPVDVERAGAIPEIATTAPPKLPRAVVERVRRVAPKSKPWVPKPAAWNDDPITDEFDEPKDALANRFQGLEL